MAVRLATRFAIASLLGILLRAEDGGGVTLTVGSAVSVGDTDIKDSSCATAPEAVDAHVASEVRWGRRGTTLPSSWSWCWLIGWDTWFISHSTLSEGFSTKHVPFPGDIIMSLENQATFSALHCMLHSEWGAAAVAVVWQVVGGQAVSKTEVVAEFFGREQGSVQDMGSCRQPGPG